MQMNVAGLRRNIKNLAHNYSDAQVKVREATSNDPWGPSSTLMAEIADLTYNVVAFSEIMQMIWKRTNDHGKNWRHVYKALLLLEYLIKTGSEKVAQQCKENIFSIQTLKDFQHLEEGKDQGVHVREKAKQLVILLKDDERLKAERARALKAKERFARTASGFGSDGSIDGPSRDRDTPVWPESDRRSVNDTEFVRPQTVGEEELQLQLAIAMSKEEAEQEESKRRSDDVRLQLALSQSEQDFKKQSDKKPEGTLVDLLGDISFGGAVGGVPSPPPQQDPWGLPQPQPRATGNDMWSSKPDPWLPPPPMSNGASASAFSALASEPSLGARTKSPAGNSSSSIEGWLQTVPPPTSNAVPVLPAKPQSNELVDAWSVKPADPWKQPSQQQPQQVPDPWNSKTSSEPLDPWAPIGNSQASGFPAPVAAPRQTTSALGGLTPGSDLDEFDIITNRSKSAQQATSSPVNDLLNRQNNNNLNDLLADMDPLAPKKSVTTTSSTTGAVAKNNPAAFLGENSALVNLDNLIKPINTTSNNNAYNPFSDSPAMKKNLFHQNQPQNPSMNQLKQQQQFQVAPLSTAPQQPQDPWAPVNNNDANQQNTINNNNIGWMNPNQSNPFL